ncbi:hypothetical protein BH11PSE11_BH11PSE11_30720 [soil metagenome]
MKMNPKRSLRGFTLVEMAIVLLIAGVAAGLVLSSSSAMLDAQKRKTVREQLNTIDIALANFVAQNKRLPCPARGTIATGALNAGVELVGPPPGAVAPGTCNLNSQVDGVVPWVTLGLAESVATDPWNGRMTYRVDPVLARAAPFPPQMNMSDCDPAGAGAVAAGLCLAPCAGATCTSPTNFLALKGLNVQNGTGGFLNNSAAGTGAAYVIISHGPNGMGARNSSGNLQPVAGAGANEMPNFNNRTIVANIFMDAQLDITATPFDDYLSHPTIMSVLYKANLGPRAH